MELSSNSSAEIGPIINWRRVSQGISVVAERKSSHLSCMMGNRELFWSQCSWIGLNLDLIWATPRYFSFLRWHQCSSRLVRHFWGTLFTSVKQIKALYLFDWEQGITLHTMHCNRASFISVRQVSWFFSRCGRNLVYVLELWRGYTLKIFVCSPTSGLLSSHDVYLRNLNYA